MKGIIITSCISLSVSILTLFSCSEDTEDPISLTANAGPDQTVAPFTTVTLDASASTGPSNSSFNYEWIVNGGPISGFLSNSSSVNPTFEATKWSLSIYSSHYAWQ